MIADLGLILLGLLVLVAGGEVLVRGATALAARLGLSPLVIGMTVVSVATSAPELAVTLDATLSGKPDLALGNVVGSNIALVLLVLGTAALAAPLVVHSSVVRVDLPFLLVLSVLLLLLGGDGRIGVLDGAVLLVVLVANVVLGIVRSRREARAAARRAGPGAPDTPVSTSAGPPLSTGRAAALVLVGVALLVAGARSLVVGATGVALSFGVSELVIGLTIVAVGTSMPEIAACLAAVRRGELDLAIGNVVGSGMANIGLVVGVTAFVGDLPVQQALRSLDMPIMVATVVLLLPMAFTDQRVSRMEGVALLGLYLAYSGYVLLDATNHDAQEGYAAVVSVVVPLLLAATVAHAAVELRGRRRTPRRV